MGISHRVKKSVERLVVWLGSQLDIEIIVIVALSQPPCTNNFSLNLLCNEILPECPILLHHLQNN